jgi:type IV pilus assembly protein PilV
MHTGSHRKSRGFTLIEALVALLCLSIGMLGIAALQMTGLRANIGAGWRSQATYLAYDIIDRMRANRSDALALNYNVGTGAAPTGSTPANLDLQAWKTNLATLPDGDGTVTVAGNVVTVTVVWNDRKADRDQLASAASYQVTFTTRSRI